MEKFKNFPKWLLLVLLLPLSISLASCDDDDKDKEEPGAGGSNISNSSNPFVGTWKNEDSYGTTMLTFNADGTGVCRVVSAYENETSYFKYVYDKNSKTLRFNYIGMDEVETWHVDAIASDYLILDGERFTRVGGSGESVSSNPFVGTWKNEDSYGTTMLTFNADGTGVYREVSAYENETSYFNYVYDKTSKTLQFKYIGMDEVETWHVDAIASDYLILDGDRYTRVR